jgi:hypothetical protein
MSVVITYPPSSLPIKTENVSFAYLAVINKLMYAKMLDYDLMILTKDIFTDRAVLAFYKTNYWINLCARVQNFNNQYRFEIIAASPTQDHRLVVNVNGSNTIVATEAFDVDIEGRGMAISVVGSTIKGMRYEIPSPVDPLAMPLPTSTISAINTAFTSGRFGFTLGGGTQASAIPMVVDCSSVYLLPPMSPSPPILGIYEVEIIGDGSRDNPYRPNLSSKLETVDKAELDKYTPDLQQAILLNKEQKVDRLALSWSAFIPTDENGIPLNKTCLVFIFEQKDRQPHLFSIKECLDEIERKPKIKKCDEKTVKKEMFKRDKRLMKGKREKEKEVDKFLGI